MKKISSRKDEMISRSVKDHTVRDWAQLHMRRGLDAHCTSMLHRAAYYRDDDGRLGIGQTGGRVSEAGIRNGPYPFRLPTPTVPG